MENLFNKKKRKTALEELSTLITEFKKYNNQEITGDELIELLRYYNNLYPLPSNRQGNFLALAIELNYYLVASCIINNAQKLKLDLDLLAYDNENDTIVGIEYELESSMETKMSINEIDNINKLEGFIKYKRYLYKNEVAFIRLKSVYSKNKEKGANEEKCI